MPLQNLEQQIVAEYGAVVGWIKNHALLSTAAAFGSGWLACDVWTFLRHLI